MALQNELETVPSCSVSLEAFESWSSFFFKCLIAFTVKLTGPESLLFEKLLND